MGESASCFRRIGLTGGIACGKSTVEMILRHAGTPVLDTDQVAHEVMAPGTAVNRAVVEAFGPEIAGPDGAIRRKELGRIVFADETARQRLNALVHPVVGQRWREWLSSYSDTLAVVSIPLLYEVGVEKEFDGVLCVWSSETRMRERLLARGMTLHEAEQRMAAQWPVDQKAARATWILKNDGTRMELQQQVHRWLRSMCCEEK